MRRGKRIEIATVYCRTFFAPVFCVGQKCKDLPKAFTSFSTPYLIFMGHNFRFQINVVKLYNPYLKEKYKTRQRTILQL